ncbi:hypothetical protein RE628_06935 [Paenibacillus sp. D2_2]|uniref:hypothetical protein n=1 Tax=Paenibacillus sp. D2_2 TaxID=3073092 RepID=UPI002814BAFD|nr:hypothetical protein [Paenibacillus sp. D2_2]WMT42150.1 hypothetical protein RE628_06935 [Paenibacillus sp. D2_2]
MGAAVTDTNGIAELSYKIQFQNDSDKEKTYPFKVSYTQNDKTYFLSSEASGKLTVKSTSNPDPEGVRANLFSWTITDMIRELKVERIRSR